MARMTEEEAYYWDEYYTKNPPKPGPNGTGFLANAKPKNPRRNNQRNGAKGNRRLCVNSP